MQIANCFASSLAKAMKALMNYCDKVRALLTALALIALAATGGPIMRYCINRLHFSEGA